MARILLGVSGGIAAYRALDVIRLATRSGHAVRVIQTPDSQRFVGGLSFAALTGAPVLVTEWERDPAAHTEEDARHGDGLAVAVRDLAGRDFLERDRQVVLGSRVDHRRRELLERPLTEVVVVRVDLTRALGGDDHARIG